MKQPFKGFRSPNYTQVPDELFDELLPELKEVELKVLLYIIRRTFGFKRDSDNISLGQMVNGIVTADGRRLDRGAGLSKSGVAKALRGLVAKNIIIPTRRSSMQRGSEATNYRLNILADSSDITPPRGGASRQGGRAQRRPPLSTGVHTGGVHSRTHGVFTGVDTQETVRDIQTVNVNGFQKPSRTRPFEQKPPPTEDPDTYLRQEALVAEMLSILGDQHSKGFYTHLARSLPDDLIWRALSETKGEAAMGRIKKSRGAYFTTAVSRLAKEQGHELNLRSRSSV